MIINSKADLRNYIDNVLTDWTFDATIEEMTEKLTSTIWWMSTPLLGEDWSCVFNRLNWDQLIPQADAEIKDDKWQAAIRSN